MSFKIKNNGVTRSFKLDETYESICFKLGLIKKVFFIVDGDITNLISSNGELKKVQEDKEIERREWEVKRLREIELEKMRKKGWLTASNDEEIKELHLEVYFDSKLPSTYFPYHCQDARIREWIHVIFVEYGDRSENIVLLLKDEYNEHREGKGLEQIDADVKRTYKEDDSEKKTKGSIEKKAKLRRILQAIDAHKNCQDNEIIGYAQSFNFIIAYLMTLTDDESDIFVLFVGLMERRQVPLLEVPATFDYELSKLYSNPEKGIFVLHHIVIGLMEKYHRKLHGAFKDQDMNVLLIGSINEISLRLFVIGRSSTKPESLLITRMFDKIVHEGYYALVRLVLSTYIANKEEIVASIDGDPRPHFNNLVNISRPSFWLNIDEGLKEEATAAIISEFKKLEFGDEEIQVLKTIALEKHKEHKEEEEKRKEKHKEEEEKHKEEEGGESKEKGGGMKKKRRRKRTRKRRKKSRRKNR
jgi:hypothetical protein